MPTPNVRFKCLHCGEALEAPGDMLGQLMDCPTCGETVEVQKAPVVLAPPPPAPHLPPGPCQVENAVAAGTAKKPVRLKEYKVLTPRDERFGGAFSPEKLETVPNEYAARGWHVVSVATVPAPSAAAGTPKRTDRGPRPG
jgi:DNA-directed RNA polymerase subunit RPC12/RpoP